MNTVPHVCGMERRYRLDDKLSSSIDLTTRGFSSREQFSVFRAAHEGVVDVSLVRSEDASFPARQVVWDLDKLIFTWTELPGEGFIHRWRHLKKAPLDHWYLALPFHVYGSDARHGEPAAPPTLHCLAKPFEAETGDDGLLALFIPRELFPYTSTLDARVDVPFDNGLGAVLAEYLFLLLKCLPELRTTEIPSIVESTRCLIAACMAPSREQLEIARKPIDLTMMERARRLIGRKLADPDLTPDMLCKELGVSRSRLYRLFEPLGGVSAYIRRQRLQRTRDALSDSSDRRSIARIAEEWGFVDPSAYSRMFKHEFGLSPKEARETGWDGRDSRFERDAPQRPFAPARSLRQLLRELSA